MIELRRAWRDLGTSNFLATPVLAAFLTWTIASTLYFDVVASPGPLLPWLFAAVASSGAATGLLMVLRRFADDIWPHGPGPWWAASLYLAAGAVRGVLLWTFGNAFGLATSIGLPTRALQSAVWAFGVMGCTGIVVARLAQHRGSMRQLGERQHELLDLQMSLHQRIDDTRRELVTQVRDTLGPTLEQLRAQLDTLGQSADATVDVAVAHFRAAVADVVRPLSRDLAEPTNPESEPTPIPPPTGPWLTSRRVPMSLAIQPTASAAILVAILLMLAVALAPLTYRSAATPLRLLLLAGLLWLSLWAEKAAARGFAWQPRTWTLLTTLAATFVVLAVVLGQLTRQITAELSGPTTTFPALAATLTALVPLAVSLAATLQELGRRTEEDRAATVEQLETLTAVLRRELWRERRRLALTVHGPIQSALVASAVTMSRPGFSSDQVPALAAALDQAMTHIDRTAGPQPPVSAAARDLSTLWVDSASITFACSRQATGMIDHDDALRTVVIEVLREGVSNAIRHGAADTIAMSIDDTTNGTIIIAIEDDGDGPPLTQTPGLGSDMFDEVALSWSLTRTGATTTLKVELGIAPESVTMEQ